MVDCCLICSEDCLQCCGFTVGTVGAVLGYVSLPMIQVAIGAGVVSLFGDTQTAGLCISALKLNAPSPLSYSYLVSVLYIISCSCINSFCSDQGGAAYMILPLIAWPLTSLIVAGLLFHSDFSGDVTDAVIGCQFASLGAIASIICGVMMSVLTCLKMSPWINPRCITEQAAALGKSCAVSGYRLYHHAQRLTLFCCPRRQRPESVSDIEIVRVMRPEEQECEVEPFTQLPWNQIEDPVEASECGHRFSLKQIESWRAACISDQLDCTCPVCRTPVDVENVMRVDVKITVAEEPHLTGSQRDASLKSGALAISDVTIASAGV